MFLENETKNIFDKKIAKNKNPLSKKSAKNIPFPKNNMLSNNIKSLVPVRQLSTLILQDNNSSNLSQKYPSEINFQIVKKNIFSSIQRNMKNKIPKCSNFKKRQISWEKTNNLKIEQVHNYKIQYLLIKEKIEKIQNQKNITLDIKNKLLQEINLKLKTILKKANDYLEEQNQENNINYNFNDNDNNIEQNKKSLKIFIDKYKKLNNKLQEINNKNYISSMNNKINEIDKEINFYEKENEELLLNENNKNELILPNIQKINKIENDLILERQLQNKIIEYKDKIAQEISISKKIKDNEINIKKLETLINELNTKNKDILDNSKDEFFIEENNSDKNNTDFININREIFKLNKKRKVTKLNEMMALKKNLNHTTLINKDSDSRIITSENQSNVEENIFKIPFTTKRKNLSCSNISMMNNDTTINNNKLIKELILKNLDEKEKEEKALINIHEQGDTSLKKYKHIKLKPNFSFTNDYHKFKDDNINKFKKLQSSAEISNLRNNENVNNNKEDLIKESVVDEISNKLEAPSTPSNEKSNKYNRNKRVIDFNMEPIKKAYNENYKANNNFDENKREIFSFTTEQREKVLNTIMYDDL